MQNKPRKRWDILIELLKGRPHKTGAEIGVFEGDTTVHLIKRLPQLTNLIGVDAFQHYPDHTVTLNPKKPKFHDADFKKIQKRFNHRVEKAVKAREGVEVLVVKKFSVEASKHVLDESLDFVFIDANHAYQYVYDDIKAWLPKIRPGGLITGHDYGVKGHTGKFGVKKAVEDIFGQKYGHIRHVWFHVVNRTVL